MAKSISSYLILALILLIFSFIFISWPFYRIHASVLIGLTYFLWGVIIHKQDQSLHLPIILEYLSFSLLAVIILIFLSFRA